MSAMRRLVGQGWAGRLGVALVVAFVLVAVLGSLRGDPLAMESEGLLPPSLDHPFGTDNLGRDLLARTGHGAATSLLVSVGSVLAATVVALPLGLLAAWHRRRPLDSMVMRTVELAQAVPPFILVIVILGLTSGPERQVLGITLTPTARLVIGLAVGFVPFMTRVVRSAGAGELGQDYVEGLLLIGVRPREVLGREVLPNVLPAVGVQFLLAVSIAVFAEGGLSYLGMGVPAPAPTLGNLIAEAGTQLLDEAWWYALLPGTVLVIGITGLNLLADAATDIALGVREITEAPGPVAEPGAAADIATPTTVSRSLAEASP